jgi:hypothetical protein
MATNRKPKSLLDAEKRIIELEQKVAGLGREKDEWYKRYTDEKTITDGLHDVLDDLGIRGYRDDSKYYRIPLSVRLFAWALKTRDANK